MSGLARFLVFAVAVIQSVIAVSEIFGWPYLARIHRRFGFTPEGADQARKVVANAGLYNAFLAAGLFWGLIHAACGSDFSLFFLACVIVAGIFGAITLDW